MADPASQVSTITETPVPQVVTIDADREPFIIVGIFIGIVLTLVAQFILRYRDKHKAKQGVNKEEANQERQLMVEQQDKMVSAMMRLEERISVVERISTEREGPTGRLSKEIEALR